MSGRWPPCVAVTRLFGPSPPTSAWRIFRTGFLSSLPSLFTWPDNLMCRDAPLWDRIGSWPAMGRRVCEWPTSVASFSLSSTSFCHACFCSLLHSFYLSVKLNHVPPSVFSTRTSFTGVVHFFYVSRFFDSTLSELSSSAIQILWLCKYFHSMNSKHRVKLDVNWQTF